MKTLIAILALVCVGCVTTGPQLPSPPPDADMDFVLRCHDSHSLCLQGCSDMWAARQDRCFDTCNEKLAQCYNLTKKTAKNTGTHTE